MSDTLLLRQSVLWPNEPLSHVQLPEDDTGFHFGAFVSGRASPVAVISLFRESVQGLDPGSIDSGAGAARFRKFACEHEWQGRGVGTQLLRETWKFAKEQLGVDIIWCDARQSAAGWYERRGMVGFGETFYKGPVKYMRMMADLDAWCV